MKVFYRIIALVLTCSLLIGCLIITASAEEVTVYDVDGGWDVSVYVGTKTQSISDFADPQHPSFSYIGTMRGVSLSNDSFTFPYGSVTVYGKFSLPSRVSVSSVMVNGYAAAFQYIDDAYYFSITQNFETYLNNYGQGLFIDIYDSNSATGNFCLDYVKIRKNSFTSLDFRYRNTYENVWLDGSSKTPIPIQYLYYSNGYVVPEGCTDYFSDRDLNQSNEYVFYLDFPLSNSSGQLNDAVLQLSATLQYLSYVGIHVYDDQGNRYFPSVQATSNFLDDQTHVFTDSESSSTAIDVTNSWIVVTDSNGVTYVDKKGTEQLTFDEHLDRVLTYDVTTAGTAYVDLLLNFDLGLLDPDATELNLMFFLIGPSTYQDIFDFTFTVNHLGYYFDVSDIDLGENQTFFNKMTDFFDRHFGNLIGSIQTALGTNNPEAKEALQTQTQINEEVNLSVSNYMATWEANYTAVIDESNEGVMGATPALQWLSGVAQNIYWNLGWFRFMYVFVLMVSVHMLILSKSGLAHKLGNMSRHRARGDH